MHHQHIVPIYDYGEASGHLFFAMERVHGVSLDKHVSVARRNHTVAMEARDAARRFAGVADALALAHKRKILHRDVKPANVLVHADGTLALADFGLSKFLGEQVSAHLTSIGGFLGTLHYSPPEQARGEPLGPASDLYSLGVTMFECMTGYLPLDGDSTEAMLHSLLHEEPSRLRQRIPRAPRDLEAVIDKLLHKKPASRYQDGEALALDLIRVAEGEPVRIRRQSPLTRLYRRARRNPVVPLAVIAALVVTVITVLFVQSLSDNKELKARQVLNEAEAKLRQESGLARGRLGIFNAILGSSGVEAAPQSAFLIQLTAAARQFPDEQATIERFRRAYRGGVLQAHPEIVEQIVAGNGKMALEELTRLINETKAKGTFDTAVRLDLYNLYLARALVYLMASIGQPSSAASDLSLANFIRSGAFLPRMLQAALSAVQSNDSSQFLRELEPFLDDPQRKRSTAEFVLALANVCAPTQAHLMRFPMRYAMRKRITQAAITWLGSEAKSAPNSGYTGLEYELSRHAGIVLKQSGDAQVVAASYQAARQILGQMVGAGSRLQAWRFTFQLLNDARAQAADLGARERIEGAIHYARVVQSSKAVGEGEQLLRSLRIEKVHKLIESMPNDPLAIELRARLDSWSAPPDDALVPVREWIRLDESDPEAQLCAFCARVRGLTGALTAIGGTQGPSSGRDNPTNELVGEATTAAAEALFCSFDRTAMLERLTRRLRSEVERESRAENRLVLNGMLDNLMAAAGTDGEDR
jgi:hypothetical protein